MGFIPGKEGCESAGDVHYPCFCEVTDHRKSSQSSARTESVGENSFSGTPYMNVERWREEPGVYSSSTHQKQSYFQFFTGTLGHILQLPDEFPSDWLNPWCGCWCASCVRPLKKNPKTPESHHIHIKKKMLSTSCLFFLFVHLFKSSYILFHKVPP